MQKKYLIYIIFFIFLSSSVFGYRAALTAPTMDRYSAERSNIAFLNANNVFTGENIFYNITILNISSYNVTGDINASGTVEATQFCIFGVGCIVNWDISNFVNDAGYITDANDPVDSGELDNLCNVTGQILKRIDGTWQCADDETGGGSGTSDNIMYINLESTKTNIATLNVTASEANPYILRVRSGRHFVTGEEV